MSAETPYPVRFCEDCRHCIRGLRAGATPYGPRLWPDPDGNVCKQPRILAESPIFAATKRAPSCAVERMHGPCGPAGHLFEAKPPPVPEPPSKPSLWHRLWGAFGRSQGNAA